MVVVKCKAVQVSQRLNWEYNSVMTAKLAFWKPGTTGPGSTLDRATEAEGNVVQSAPSFSSSIQSQRERLPIFKHSQFPTLLMEFLSTKTFPGEKLLYCLEKYGVLIVVGQTGCGKTTRGYW
jgi:ATP-dependent RNA helicase DDX35